MVSPLDRIQTVVVAKQGPPGGGLTVAEKDDIFDQLADLDADIADLTSDIATNTANIATNTANLAEAREGWATFVIDGGGTTIATGVRLRVLIPHGCVITADPVSGDAWRVGLDQSGSISLDLWRATHGSYPVTSASRISGTVGSQNPRVLSALKNQSGDLTGWTTSMPIGQWLFINVASVTAAQQAVLGLYLVMN